jgi:hypothetical protein
MAQMPLQLSAATQLASRNRAAFPGSQKIGGADAQTPIGCRGSNARQTILFEIRKVICLAFFSAWSVERIFFISRWTERTKWAKAHYLIQLRRHEKCARSSQSS